MRVRGEGDGDTDLSPGEDAEEIGDDSAAIANEYRELLVQAFNKVTLTHSLTHPLTHSLTHSSPHSLTQVTKGLEMHVNNIASRRRFQARVLVLTFFRLNAFTR